MTKEKLLYYFEYLPCFGLLLWRNVSHLNRTRLIGKIAGRISCYGYQEIKIEGKHLKAHRIIWFLEKDEWVNEIDHIDGNKLNNRIENLRSVTVRQNQQNQKRHRAGKLLGSSFDKTKNLWRSQIHVDGVQISLGNFGSERLAHEAYVKKLNEISL